MRLKICVLFDLLRKRWRWLLRLAVFGLLTGWILTWALDSPLRPALAERDGIRAAAVHVSGRACGRFSEGSGFVVEPGLALTSAHVVAGVEDIKVITPDGVSQTGVLAGFDSGRDIAAILISDSHARPVALAPTVAAAGDRGDVATVDGDDGLGLVPFTVKRRIWLRGDMVYDEGAEARRALELNSLLGPGDSGAALVNVDGEVWGMVFAIARGERDQGDALDRVDIGAFLSEIDRVPLPTPPCATR